MVLTEGVDLPAVSCLVLARPTKHMGLYRQMVGRALRPSPGKVFALILDHAGAVFEHGLPDEPVQWTLSEDQRAVNPVQTARALRQAPGLAECPECKAVRMQGSQCPVCGWRPQPKARSVVVADGELGEVGRNRTAKSAAYSDADKRLWHGALLYIANERAMRRPFNMRGWVYHKYSEKFGQPPPLDAPPGLPPSAEIRAWVRSSRHRLCPLHGSATGCGMNNALNTVERARNRWREILPRLGIDPEFLQNRHGPCPLCGGKDRYRFDDKDGTGSYICGQCGAGVGIILIKKKNGWDHRTACSEIDKIIGDSPAQPTPPDSNQAQRQPRPDGTLSGGCPVAGDRDRVPASPWPSIVVTRATGKPQASLLRRERGSRGVLSCRSGAHRRP